jgi:hypothetical protein
MDVSDTAIVALIISARLLIPLLIFRYPLPAIIACLVIDAADQTILQKLTSIDTGPDGMYQITDKALDIYYLTMAYCSVLRNWTNGAAVEVARFLWYYRLVGVALFEATGARWLLMVFPNTFEYYFIAFEVIRTMWDPRRLTRRHVIAVAAFIWIVIKLPQEWWIHVAQNDFTDFMGDNPWAWGVIALAAVIVGAIAWKFSRTAPRPDWSFRVDRDKATPVVAGLDLDEPQLRWPRAEKIVLLSLVTTIFTYVLNIEARFWQVALGAALVVVVTGLVSEWLAERGERWTHTITEFVVLAVINAVLINVYAQVIGDGLERWQTLFIALLLTLIITAYDRCRRIREVKLAPLRAAVA